MKKSDFLKFKPYDLIEFNGLKLIEFMYTNSNINKKRFWTYDTNIDYADYPCSDNSYYYTVYNFYNEHNEYITSSSIEIPIEQAQVVEKNNNYITIKVSNDNKKIDMKLTLDEILFSCETGKDLMFSFIKRDLKTIKKDIKYDKKLSQLSGNKINYISII